MRPKPQLTDPLQRHKSRIVAAKIPLLVFLLVAGALTAVLVWWAFFLLPQNHQTSVRSTTSTPPSESVYVPPGYSRVELPDAASVPNVGTSGWICAPSVVGVTCFVPDGSPLPPGAIPTTTASPNTPAPPASGESGDWTNKVVALVGALAVLLTALGSIGWRPFGRGGESVQDAQ